MKKIKRQIYFYEVELQKYSKEDDSFIFSKQYKEDMKVLFEQFNNLPFDKENLDCSMYLKKQNGTYDFIKVDNISDNYIEGKLINSDDSGLTYYEENGEIKFLKDTISTNASIAEISHFVFFLDTGILAFEYNVKSSHSQSLSNYIRSKMKDTYIIEFKNLLNKNREKRFNSIEKVKSFTFTTSSKCLLESNGSKKGFFEAASSVINIINRDTDVEQNITIKISPSRITKNNKRPYYDAQELKSSINEAINDNDFKLHIVGFNELNEQIVVNYSNDILIKGITIESTKIESRYFYQKIKEEYNKAYKEYLE